MLHIRAVTPLIGVFISVTTIPAADVGLQAAAATAE
jgi:hypothetical protein